MKRKIIVPLLMLSCLFILAGCSKISSNSLSAGSTNTPINGGTPPTDGGTPPDGMTPPDGGTPPAGAPAN
ncbi:MAG: hypothetical protein WCK59_02630 [Candidatus Falkowbacteria bacterium]